MSSTEATELDDYVDPPAPLEVADVMTHAMVMATIPRPTLREMIEAVTACRYNLEEWQERCILCGINDAPDKGTMRRAAVLGATANFLMLVDANQDAVKRALKGRV